MPAIDAARIALDGIGHLLKDRAFSVPRYQRSYKWEKRNALALFQDISNAIAQVRDEYFLGSIVCIKGAGDRLEIVDGQQRVATTTILIAAIRDHFALAGDEQRTGDIERDFLYQRNRRTQELTPRLVLNDTDHEFFLQRILKRPSERPVGLNLGFAYPA